MQSLVQCFLPVTYKALGYRPMASVS